jgi:hypothetical protein
MKIRTLAVLATLVVLSSCSTATTWNHPTKDEQQFEQERYDCVKDGEQHAAYRGYDGNSMIVDGRAKECMRVKGYTYTKAPKRDAALAE